MTVQPDTETTPARGKRPKQGEPVVDRALSLLAVFSDVLQWNRPHLFAMLAIAVDEIRNRGNKMEIGQNLESIP